MAVFLLGGLLLGAGFYPAEDPVSGATVYAAPAGILGGPSHSVPAEKAEPYVVGVERPAFDASINEWGGGAQPEFGETPSVAESGLPGAGNFGRQDVFVYKVRRGDTLYGIAKYFGITLETLTSANPGLRSKLLQPSDELNILPASGIIYKVVVGDTLESVAASFAVPEESIVQFNKSVNFNSLGEGASLMIPGVASAFAYHAPSAKDFRDRFIKPAEGYNWGELHPHNAIDIAGACGAPVVAAAEGLVIPDENFGEGRGGWNGGYGSFVLIEHPFGDGVRTRYAHLKSVATAVGEYIRQGQEIGSIGASGDATGCHVHFEIYGAANPFAK